MKKMRVLSLAMAAAMSLSLLAGCGGGTSSEPSTNPDSGSGSSTGADIIKIGGIGPLTGSAAVYGLATKQGAEIAIEEINALGGPRNQNRLFSLHCMRSSLYFLLRLFSRVSP